MRSNTLSATTKVVIFRNIKAVPLTEVSPSILGFLDALGKKTSLTRQAGPDENDKAGGLKKLLTPVCPMPPFL
jgi:hypothetical protein